MWLEFLLSTLAIGLSLAQTSYNNGLWTPSPSVYQPTTTQILQQSTTTYQSWTTWTSMLVYGTVIVTVTSTVPCTPTPNPVWVTTTQYTTPCNECRPVYTTTYWNGYGGSTAVTATTITAAPTTTSVSLTAQQRPVTTITSGTVVYIVYGSTPAAIGQVTTNGVVQVISAGGNREDADLVRAGLAMAVAALALVML